MFGRLGQLGRLGTLGVCSRSTAHIAGAAWDEIADSYEILNASYNYHDAHINPVLVTPGSEGTGDVLLDKYDYTKDRAGNPVVVDGSTGKQMMMRFDKFYYGYGYEDDTHKWRVSARRSPSTPYLHSAFVKAGVEVPCRYIGIYEACGYDVSAGTYVDGDGTNSWLDASNDKLGSVVGYKPLSKFTRAQGRQMAANVGAGWSMTTFWHYAMLKLLYITRYDDLDSQSVLGAGNTNFSGWAFATRISATGQVLSVTAPGQSTAGGNLGDYCNLFGIENPFGDIWEWVDGWNINSGNNYVCSDPSLFADDTTSSYVLYGSTNPTGSGWQNTLQQHIGFLPASVGASSTTKVTDNYWYTSGWRSAMSGGRASTGAAAGLFALYTSGNSSNAGSDIGGRLCF